MEAVELLRGDIILPKHVGSRFLELPLLISIIFGDDLLHIGAVFYAVGNARGDGVAFARQQYGNGTVEGKLLVIVTEAGG